jgi:hypothetical protein
LRQQRSQFRGPAYFSDNVSLFKRIPIYRAFTLEGRFDAFNMTNTPAFGLPTASYTSGSFGKITSTLGSGVDNINGSAVPVSFRPQSILFFDATRMQCTAVPAQGMAVQRFIARLKAVSITPLPASLQDNRGAWNERKAKYVQRIPSSEIRDFLRCRLRLMCNAASRRSKCGCECYPLSK